MLDMGGRLTRGRWCKDVLGTGKLGDVHRAARPAAARWRGGADSVPQCRLARAICRLPCSAYATGQGLFAASACAASVKLATDRSLEGSGVLCRVRRGSFLELGS